MGRRDKARIKQYYFVSQITVNIISTIPLYSPFSHLYQEGLGGVGKLSRGIYPVRNTKLVKQKPKISDEPVAIGDF
jgi:hypothetical protein